METYADHKVMPGFGNNMRYCGGILSLMMINVFLSIPGHFMKGMGLVVGQTKVAETSVVMTGIKLRV